jgi:hypothetical protein
VWMFINMMLLGGLGVIYSRCEALESVFGRRRIVK